MRKQKLFISMFIFFIIFSLPLWAADKVAVVVGVSDYQSPLVNDLYFSDDDAEVTSALLEAWGWQVVTLTNAQATKEAIKTAILNNIQNASQFLFYFSGHGTTDRTATGYICPYDTSPYSYANDISEDELENWLLTASPTTEIGVILDSCFSGAFIDRQGKRIKFLPKLGITPPKLAKPILFGKNLARNGWVVVTGSRGNETSIETCFPWPFAACHGFLTYWLDTALYYGTYFDANHNGLIALEEAFGIFSLPFLERYLDRIDQHPQLYDGNGSDEFVIYAIESCGN